MPCAKSSKDFRPPASFSWRQYTIVSGFASLNDVIIYISFRFRSTAISNLRYIPFARIRRVNMRFQFLNSVDLLPSFSSQSELMTSFRNAVDNFTCAKEKTAKSFSLPARRIWSANDNLETDHVEFWRWTWWRRCRQNSKWTKATMVLVLTSKRQLLRLFLLDQLKSKWSYRRLCSDSMLSTTIRWRLQGPQTPRLTSSSYIIRDHLPLITIAMFRKSFANCTEATFFHSISEAYYIYYIIFYILYSRFPVHI